MYAWNERTLNVLISVLGHDNITTEGFFYAYLEISVGRYIKRYVSTLTWCRVTTLCAGGGVDVGDLRFLRHIFYPYSIPHYKFTIYSYQVSFINKLWWLRLVSAAPGVHRIYRRNNIIPRSVFIVGLFTTTEYIIY